MRELTTIGSFQLRRVGGRIMKPARRRHVAHLPGPWGWTIGALAMTADLDSAAKTLLVSLNANGPSPHVDMDVYAFQQAANKAGYTPKLDEDGEYGQLTAGALVSTVALDDTLLLIGPVPPGLPDSAFAPNRPRASVAHVGGHPLLWIAGIAGVALAAAGAAHLLKHPKKHTHKHQALALVI